MSDKNISIVKRENEGILFSDMKSSTNYLEIKTDGDYKHLTMIIRTDEVLNQINSHANEDIDKNFKDILKECDEITFIIDFQALSIELDTEQLKKFINYFYINDYDDDNSDKIKYNLIIKNSYINPDKELPILFEKNLILNKLEIDDELYSFSTNLNHLFPKLKVNELILKKFKFNSKAQISDFFQFILKTKCEKLTLDDIFIELIIKENEKDEEYKDLDIYISYVDGLISLDNVYAPIQSLTLRDCPLFAIIGNMFCYSTSTGERINIYKDIDIDETSLINPSIITKFKIKDGKYDICFDLDSFKIKFEEENEGKEFDYIDYLTYIFNIIVSFTTKDQAIKVEKDDDGIGQIDRNHFYKLTFKNFDTTKLEFVMDDDFTFIEEKNWVLDNEEKKKKKRWEDFEKLLETSKYLFIPNVSELVFDNCSNFFIKWIIFFITGKKNSVNKEYDFDLLKIKKCGKDYINIEDILKMKIKNLILFDSPLIIGGKFPEGNNSSHLEVIKNELGSVENLTIKINSLESYGKEYNLNTYKTYEILLELIKKSNFNKNLTFELNALSNIMTFLVYKIYSEKPEFYKGINVEEEGNDVISLTDEKQEETEKKNFEKKYLPLHMFFGAKKLRDYIYYQAFNIESLENSKITLKNMTIRKVTENFDNQNYLLKRYKLDKKVRVYSENNDLKKMDFGSDGFFIDRDYKYFFSENKINTIVLKNVSFSNFKDPVLKCIEGETIINLLSKNNDETESINKNKNIFKDIEFPNYILDYRTLNIILYKNYLFEDISIMFKYFYYKIDEQSEIQRTVSIESIEKKKTLDDYFKNFKKIFDCFCKDNKELTIILNSRKDLKEFYCTFSILKLLVNVKKIKERLIPTNKKDPIIIELPDKKEIEKNIGAYFLKERNEEEKEVYSEMNYYYTSEDEEKMIKNKKISLSKYIFNLDFDSEILKLY